MLWLSTASRVIWALAFLQGAVKCCIFFKFYLWSLTKNENDIEKARGGPFSKGVQACKSSLTRSKWDRQDDSNEQANYFVSWLCNIWKVHINVYSNRALGSESTKFSCSVSQSPLTSSPSSNISPTNTTLILLPREPSWNNCDNWKHGKKHQQFYHVYLCLAENRLLQAMSRRLLLLTLHLFYYFCYFLYMYV